MKNNNISELIKEKARKLFFSYGLKSVSMEDIAQQSGISKRTIYEFFDDKHAIVYAVVAELIRSHQQILTTVQSTVHDAIEEVLKQDAALSMVFKHVRPAFFYELENLFSDIWEEVEQHKRKICKAIIDNLRKGQGQGLYREDIDRKLISDLRLHQLVNVMKPELLTSFDLSVEQLAAQFTILYLHSITTEKGKKIFDNYLSENRPASLDIEIDNIHDKPF
jgi:AcrR family transcriptional regulator